MTEYKLVQKGRWIHISPAPTHKMLKRIEDEFSYIKKGAQYMPNPNWAKVKLYQPGNKRLPIGLYSRLKKLLTKHNYPYKNGAVGGSLGDLKPKDKGLYDFQKSALKMLLIRNGGILQIPTGGGKTRVAISAIETLNRPTLVIVPTLDLVKQWEVQVDKDVVVKTYQSLKSKSFIQKFEFVIFDECHRVAAKTLQLIGLNLSEKAITLGLSATPFMRDDDNLKVESVLGPVVYKISLRELIKEGYLVDALVHYHHLETMDADFMDYPTTYNNYILNNHERNAKIVELVKEANGPVLILVKLIEHGTYLKDILEMMEEDVVFLNGSVKDREEKMNHNVIIATSIFDEGIDIPRLETLIIAGGAKSAIKTSQRIGRVLRKFPNKKVAMVHDFADATKWLVKHYDERRAIYEEDFEVVDVE
ncbi:DEAD/DEAH box helicase [archaeon]|nr:DEAD/DEAH box helicase [archaeon]